MSGELTPIPDEIPKNSSLWNVLPCMRGEKKAVRIVKGLNEDQSVTKTWAKHLLGITLLMLSPLCWAEYRVYQYYVKPASPLTLGRKSEVVTSTLDPTSYSAYHAGGLLKVELLRSWMCKGHTAKRPLCASPLEHMSNLPANTGVDRGTAAAAP